MTTYCKYEINAKQAVVTKDRKSATEHARIFLNTNWHLHERKVAILTHYNLISK